MPPPPSQYAYQAEKRKDEMGGAVQHEVACEGGDAHTNARLLLDRTEALGL